MLRVYFSNASIHGRLGCAHKTMHRMVLSLARSLRRRFWRLFREHGSLWSMWKYCPSCAAAGIRFDGLHKYSCPACGFVFYQNTAAATGCVIRGRQGVLLLVRGKEPARGKLDLPGGFVDPGEGALEGLVRELREEIGWAPPESPPAGEKPGVRPPAFTLFASFPNTYPYRDTVYHTCDMFFALDAPELTEQDLRFQAGEIGGFHFVKPEEIRMEDLAFDSTRRALKAYREIYCP